MGIEKNANDDVPFDWTYEKGIRTLAEVRGFANHAAENKPVFYRA